LLRSESFAKYLVEPKRKILLIEINKGNEKSVADPYALPNSAS